MSDSNTPVSPVNVPNIDADIAQYIEAQLSGFRQQFFDDIIAVVGDMLKPLQNQLAEISSRPSTIAHW